MQDGKTWNCKAILLLRMDSPQCPSIKGSLDERLQVSINQAVRINPHTILRTKDPYAMLSMGQLFKSVRTKILEMPQRLISTKDTSAMQNFHLKKTPSLVFFNG